MVECNIEAYNMLLGLFAGQLMILNYAIRIILIVGLIIIILRLIDRYKFKKRRKLC